MLNYFQKKWIILSFITVIFFFLSSSGFCGISKNEIPQLIKSGLAAYKAKGPEAAILEWIKDSPYEGSKDAISQANIFKQVETFYGDYVDFHPIGVINLTPSCKFIYLSMNFESGPVFAKFMVYKTKTNWILSGKFNFHT
ncbi:MAG: hypothetical protein GY857_16645, partial [Desulfobacula sp.]|nr:hypothetical protein [Desulfobacula sp.]